MSQPTRPEARVLWASGRREPQEETDDETSRCVRARRGGGQSEILHSIGRVSAPPKTVLVLTFLVDWLL